MPGMSSGMVSKVHMCTLCNKEECCKSTFRDIALALRFDYILNEYNTLSDAWRVYQGVALYREYRGIGGETKQLDVEPRPCQLCLVKIVNMAQAIYVVTSTVEACSENSQAEFNPEEVAEIPVASNPVELCTNQNKSLVKGPVPIAPKKRWSTESKEYWSTSPRKRSTSGAQSNGHPDSSQTPVNQIVPKVLSKTVNNKNRRESPLTKSKESLLKGRDFQTDSSVETHQINKQQTSQISTRPKRSGRSFLDRNPDFHFDLGLRGDSSETDSLEGIFNSPMSVRKSKKQNVSNSNSKTLPPTDSNENQVLKQTSRTGPQSEIRPKRLVGRSHKERIPDFAVDNSLSKTNDTNSKVNNNSTDAKLEINPSEMGNSQAMTLCESESVIEPWRSDEFRAEHLSKLDQALGSAGWSQAIRSGKNMEKEVFNNSNTEADYVAGISRLVAHFDRGRVEKTDDKKAQIEGSVQVVDVPSLKQLTDVPSKTPLTKKKGMFKGKSLISPSKKPFKSNMKTDKMRGIKKVEKNWSKVKVNCRMCGQLQIKSKMKEHILVFHKNNLQFPCAECDLKCVSKTELELHIKKQHEDLNPEGSVSESDGSVSSSSTSTPLGSKGRAKAVRAQYQYIVKTSKSGKQGRKYLDVGDESGTNRTVVPESDRVGQKKSQVNQSKVKKKSVKKVITPGSHVERKENELEKEIPDKQSEVLQYMKGAEDNVREVLHEASVSEIVADEFAGSNSESEISEPRSKEVETLNAHYLNKPEQVEDENALIIESVKSVTPRKEISVDKKDVSDSILKNLDIVENCGDETVDSGVIASVPVKEIPTPIKERPQRRKRSLADIHPDFVLDLPSTLKSDKLLKKGKYESKSNEESTSVAKNWFEVNQEL